ncbi:MAG: hypothetical protein AAGJ68_02380 [Pseudomonadota bacterium]
MRKPLIQLIFHPMIRLLTSCLWLIAALALGFESVAQPCDLQAEMQTEHAHDQMSDMPCHDGMMMDHGHEQQMPEHESSTCCCAALLGNGMTPLAPELQQPVPSLMAWITPLPDSANSILPEHDPPPPRA